MANVFRSLRRTFSKPVLFGIYGAIGCLLAAILLGEVFLALTKLPPPTPQTNHAIVLLIDSSSSMGDGKLDEVKSAATDFVQRQDLSNNKLAVVNFGNTVSSLTSLTNNPNRLKTAINSLRSSGGTPMAEGINVAVSELRSTLLNPSILLFTDGLPDDPDLTIEAAKAAKRQSIKVVAVATGDADVNFLADLTGDSSLVFFANSGEFDRAFQAAEAKIYGTLIESEGAGNYGLVHGSLRIGGWTAILAIGISLILIVGQNQYMRRRLLSLREAGVSIFGGLTAGLIAGGVGQLLFSPVATLPYTSEIGRILGWTILGALVGGGTSFFVPNLKLNRAMVGGSLGGGLGAIGFLIAAARLGDLSGRLIGAAILGFCIGLMIAWAEKQQLSTESYLVVHWSPKEQTKILLGKRPVTLGSSYEAQIHLSKAQGFYPVTAKIFKEGNNIIMEYDGRYAQDRGMRIVRHELNNGDRRKLGKITVEVRNAINQGIYKVQKFS